MNLECPICGGRVDDGEHRKVGPTEKGIDDSGSAFIMNRYTCPKARPKYLTGTMPKE